MRIEKDIKIFVAVHKKCWLPKSEIYVPIHVGKKNSKEKLEILGDDTGVNISQKNSMYCELTAVYWAWKNVECEYFGFVQYGRYLAYRSIKNILSRDKRQNILAREEIESMLDQCDVILPKKRRYFVESIFNHYAHTHSKIHLEETRNVIIDLFPEYQVNFDKVMKRTYAHMFNLFIMKKEVFQEYCAWLFPILEALETRIDITEMTCFEKRYLGRISELLLDIWIDKKQISYREVDWVYLRKVNFRKKTRDFLLAKFRNKKYEESF